MKLYGYFRSSAANQITQWKSELAEGAAGAAFTTCPGQHLRMT
jgi:hypothetical protein